MGIVASRRLFVPRVRATTSPVDRVALILLGIMVVLDIATTAINAPLGFDYRETISIWFRGLFAGNADVSAAQRAPLIFQIHAIAAWLLFLVWPFTRLVHAWSYPLWYLWRPFIVYRSRGTRHPNEPGTTGRRWRKIGTRFQTLDEPHVRARRVYEECTNADRDRILVDLLWPHGSRRPTPTSTSGATPWPRPSRCAAGTATLRTGSPPDADPADRHPNPGDQHGRRARGPPERGPGRSMTVRTTDGDGAHQVRDHRDERQQPGHEAHPQLDTADGADHGQRVRLPQVNARHCVHAQREHDAPQRGVIGQRNPVHAVPPPTGRD